MFKCLLQMLTYRQEERLQQQQNIFQNAHLIFFLFFSCDICWVSQELKLKKKLHHFLHFGNTIEARAFEK